MLTFSPVLLTTGNTDFDRLVGEVLRAARRRAGHRLGRLATPTLPASLLRAVERGEVALDRPLLTQLAQRYGVDLGDLLPQRATLIVGADGLVVNDIFEPCDTGSLTSCLSGYLRLIGRVRQEGVPPIALRRDDIHALADRLDLPCATVISRLADLMNARGVETRAMVQLYLDGASVVGVQAPAPR